MTEFLEENNILIDNQFGFRRNHSTSHAIICLVEQVAKALDQGKLVVGLRIHLKKALDGICHKTLLKKLYGVKSYRCNVLNYTFLFVMENSIYNFEMHCNTMVCK